MCIRYQGHFSDRVFCFISIKCILQGWGRTEGRSRVNIPPCYDTATCNFWPSQNQLLGTANTCFCEKLKELLATI